MSISTQLNPFKFNAQRRRVDATQQALGYNSWLFILKKYLTHKQEQLEGIRR